jgi:hypothetical protein
MIERRFESHLSSRGTESGPLGAPAGSDAKGKESTAPLAAPAPDSETKKGPVVENFYWTHTPTGEAPSEKILKKAARWVKRLGEEHMVKHMPWPDNVPLPSKAPESFKPREALHTGEALSPTKERPYAFEFDVRAQKDMHYKFIMSSRGGGRAQETS